MGVVVIMGVVAFVFVQYGLGGVVDLLGVYNLDISFDDKHVYIVFRNYYIIGVFVIDENDGYFMFIVILFI